MSRFGSDANLTFAQLITDKGLGSFIPCNHGGYKLMQCLVIIAVRDPLTKIFQ